MSSENSNKCLAHTNPSPPLFPLPQIIVIFFDGILAYRFLIISANCNPAFSIKISFDIPILSAISSNAFIFSG